MPLKVPPAHRHGFFLAGSGYFLVFLLSPQLPLPGCSGSVPVGLHCPLPAPRLAQRAPQVRLPGGPAWLGPSSAVSQDGGQKNKIKKIKLLVILQGIFLWEFFRSSYESIAARKWDVFGQQLHRTLVRAEAALCGCLIPILLRNQTLIYCCLQA